MSQQTVNQSKIEVIPSPHPIEYVPLHEATTRYKALGQAATLELHKNLGLEDTIRQQNEQLNRDKLTGLANEKRLLEVLSWATEREDKKPFGEESNLGLLMFDLDKFKKLNDTLGHDMGDRVLNTIGQTLNTMLRGSDVTARSEAEVEDPHAPTPTRKHGDEFYIVVPVIEPLHPEAVMTKSERMRSMADRVRATVMEDIMQSDYAPQLVAHDVELGLSIGAAIYERGEGVESLMKRVDMAMYDDKQARGGGRQ